MKKQRILYIVKTDLLAYPPLLSSIGIFNASGWDVSVIDMPSKETGYETFPDEQVTYHLAVELKGGRIWRFSKRILFDIFLLYAARKVKPDCIYVSDPYSAFAGFLVHMLTRCTLIYHEHDTPYKNNRFVGTFVKRKSRRYMLQHATKIVFPSRGRAMLTRELEGMDFQFDVVMNCPSLPVVNRVIQHLSAISRPKQKDSALKLVFVGSMSPDRLPHSIFQLIQNSSRRVGLTIFAYDGSGGEKIVDLIDVYCADCAAGDVTYGGTVGGIEKYTQLCKHDIGLSLVNTESELADQRYMAGASNKTFEYLLAGIPVIVPDDPEWHKVFGACAAVYFVKYGSMESLQQQLVKIKRESHGINWNAIRDMLLNSWNYEKQFDPIVRSMLS